jgi:hypothetical protein
MKKWFRGQNKRENIGNERKNEIIWKRERKNNKTGNVFIT